MAYTPQQAIDVANSVFGRHQGYRALHAKGTLCAGEFTPTARAHELTRAAHMQGPEVPATIRFSNGSGDPNHADWAPDPRGLAIKFYLPDGSRTDIVAVSSPRFPTRTPDGFIELVEAQGAGAAAAWKLPLFLVRHPEAIPVLPAVAPTLRRLPATRRSPTTACMRSGGSTRWRRALRPLHAAAGGQRPAAEPAGGARPAATTSRTRSASGSGRAGPCSRSRCRSRSRATGSRTRARPGPSSAGA